MRNLIIVTLILTLMAAFGTSTASAGGGGKQTICHIPPGNPANWHTITISVNAVDKHVEKHGDLVGVNGLDVTCLDVCEELCDDGNACTQDVESNLEECLCIDAPRPEVNCDDSNPCTVDSCSPELGACTYDSTFLDGSVCDDGDPDTGDGVCSAGACIVEPVEPVDPPPSAVCPCTTDDPRWSVDPAIAASFFNSTLGGWGASGDLCVATASTGIPATSIILFDADGDPINMIWALATGATTGSWECGLGDAGEPSAYLSITEDEYLACAEQLRTAAEGDPVLDNPVICSSS